jgi:hypothetical protein
MKHGAPHADPDNPDEDEDLGFGDGGGGGGGGRGRGGGLARSLHREMSMGASPLGSMGALSRGMKSLSGMLRPSAAVAPGAAGTMASLAPALMKGSGWLAAATLGMEGLQKGGAMYQGYKNMGLVRGGGAGEGLETEAGIRMMAINPFISTEQARQVITAGLTEGYTGKQFDTVTEFMASNLKNMNISVSDSVQLLRKNVDEGGQSVKGLGQSLVMLKELSKTGAMSLPDMQQSFQQTSSALISAGMNGPAAAESATLATNVWSDNQTLKGSFGPMTQEMGSNPSSLAMMRTFGGLNAPAGLLPQAMPMWMAEHGQNMPEVVGKTLKTIALQCAQAPGAKKKGTMQYMNAVAMFQMRLRAVSPNSKGASDITAAQQMFDSFVFGEDPVAKAQKGIDDINQKVEGGYSVAATMGGRAGAAMTGVWDTVRAGFDLLHGDTAAAGRAWHHGQDAVGVAEYNAGAEAQNPMVNNIVQAEGGGRNVQVQVGGKWQELTGKKEQIEALTHGGKWRRRGDNGEGITLAQTPQQMDRGFNTGQTNVNFSPATVTIKIDQDGRAVASPEQVQLTPNQMNANAGVSGAQMNNPQPSDIANYRRHFPQ